MTVDSLETLPPSVGTVKAVYCAGQAEPLKCIANIVPASAPVPVPVPVPVMIAVVGLHFAAVKPGLGFVGVEVVGFAQAGQVAVEEMVKPGLQVMEQVSKEQANRPRVQLFQR